MVSTYTTNKDLEKPGNGDYVDTWNIPVNSDLTIVDSAFGTVQTYNATSGSQTLGSYDHTTKALVNFSYIPFAIKVQGAMSANVVYTVPSGVGGQWIVYNVTTDSTGTGPWTVRFASGGGGTSTVIPRSSPISIYSDGTNIRPVSSVPAGIITMWSGSTSAIPNGWFLCDGTNGTPDLRNRFIVGAGSTYPVGNTGGSADATLPAHSHTAIVYDPGHTHYLTGLEIGNGSTSFGAFYNQVRNDLGNTMSTEVTGITVGITTTGSSATNANLPPYYALAYIMKA